MNIDYYKSKLVKLLAVILCVAAMFAFSFNVTYGATRTTYKTMVVSAYFVGTSMSERPTIQLRLCKDGKTAKILVLDSTNNWKVKVNKLNTKYTWTVKQAGSVSGYHKLKTLATKKAVKLGYSKVHTGTIISFPDNYN